MTLSALGRIIGAGAILLAFPSSPVAQEAPPTPGADESVPQLELAADPSVSSGQIAAVQGTVGAEGVRYTVASLSILQPVVVMLYAAEESDDLTLSLFKSNWTEPRRSASTRGSGVAEFTIRTEGGLRIEVRGSSQPKPYALVVWAGDEMRRPMRDVLVTYDEFKKSNPAQASRLTEGGGVGGAAGAGSGLPMAVWIVVAGLIGGAAVFFGMRALGGRRRA
jgi:hypothetical protein